MPGTCGSEDPGCSLRSRSDQRRLLDVGDGAVPPVPRARLSDGVLHTRRDLESEVAWHVRLQRSGHDHPSHVAEALEWVGGEDTVDRVEGVAPAVRLDIVGATRQVLGEARGDLVGIARLGQNALTSGYEGWATRSHVSRAGAAMITVQPGLPTASIMPPRYPSPDETRVRIGLTEAKMAYGLESGTP